MPHTSSAKKHLRQDEKRRRYNRAIMKGLKKQLRSFEEVAEQGTIEELRTQYNTSAKMLDKAAARKVIHANQASNSAEANSNFVGQKTGPSTT